MLMVDLVATLQTGIMLKMSIAIPGESPPLSLTAAPDYLVVYDFGLRADNHL